MHIYYVYNYTTHTHIHMVYTYIMRTHTKKKLSKNYFSASVTLKWFFAL